MSEVIQKDTEECHKSCGHVKAPQKRRSVEREVSETQDESPPMSHLDQNMEAKDAKNMEEPAHTINFCRNCCNEWRVKEGTAEVNGVESL